MGKGDRKTRKGKIYRGSHGNVRPHSPKSKSAVRKTTVQTPKPAPRPAVKAAPHRPATKAAPSRPAAKTAPAKKTVAKKAAPKKPA